MIIRAHDLVLPGADNINAPAIGIDNKVASGNFTVNSEQAAFPARNVANPATYLEWRSNNAGVGETIYVVGLSGLSNYIGFARHNFGTTGRSIGIDADTGAGYVTIVPNMTPDDDAPLMFLFPAALYINFRIFIGAGSDVVRLAVLQAGLTTPLERNIYVGHTPITLGDDPSVVTGMSESGEFLGRVITGETQSTSATLDHLTPGWVRGVYWPFIELAKTKPFFFGWRPGTYPREIGFCWLSSMSRPTNALGNGMMSATLEMRGIA